MRRRQSYRGELRGKDNYDVEQIVEPRKVVAMQKALETVHIDPAILGYIVQVVQRTRADRELRLVHLPGPVKVLFKASRASAAIDGRDYVTLTMSRESLSTWSATGSY